ncbi:WD40 repeat domain-containing protein [Nocardioides ungokensis]|uniref:WD40 repeat domain-containing protein n=1 Tax=Nocardioides ungokensis TaxID=1643322 RepID=UPI0015DF66CB|nr:WD40 repeat domain-containing protein [Nocardioides ungokensis]
MRDRVFAGALVVPFVLGTVAAPSRPGHTELTFRDPEIVESSGLVVVHAGGGDLVVTTNDSGDTGRVFAVDPASGETVGVTHWSDDPTDVEALAPAGPGAVWVGDIGDNTASRDSIEVTRVPVGRGERTVDAATYDLTYPTGPVNAETLLSDPTTGRLYVASKNVFGGVLYAAPAHLDPDGTNRLRPLGPVLPIATDGAFLADGKHVVLRDYSRAVVYTFPALEPVGDFRLPDQDQGEGLATTDDGDLLVSSEGQDEPVLRVSLPSSVRRAVAPAGHSPSSRPSQSVSSSPSDQPSPADSRTTSEPAGRPVWPWFLTAWLALGGLVVVARLIGGRRPGR